VLCINCERARHPLVFASHVRITKLIFRLLFTNLLFMGTRYLTILLHYSLVILGGVFSTYQLVKETKRMVKLGETVDGW
jgi:hypothetical protein